MSRTVSVKPIATLTEQCSQCGLWFEFLHPSADGRFLCRMCLTLGAGTGPRRFSRSQGGSPMAGFSSLLGEGAFAALTDSTYGTVTFSVSTPVFVFLNLPSNDRMCWPADSGSRT
jgi:hypothetical protein